MTEMPTAELDDEALAPGAVLDVSADQAGLRIDKVLALAFPEWSRERLQECFSRDQVWRNGQPVPKKTRVQAGDEIRALLPVQRPIELPPVNLPLAVLYEDDALLAVNKAPGIIVHPGAGTTEPTLVQAVLHHTGGQLAPAGGALRPGVVHRLDRETSGVLLFAKTDAAYYALTQQFARREVRKQYVALVRGAPALDAGTIREPIGRHPRHRTRMAVVPQGKPAWTDWRVRERFGRAAFAWVECDLHTGRTHQLRVHLQHLGCPIWGDATYGDRPAADDPVTAPRVLLHSAQTRLTHPLNGCTITLEAPLPEDFQTAVTGLQQTLPDDR